MRVTQRAPDVLVIEEGAVTTIVLGTVSTAIGVVFPLIGWRGGQWVFIVVGMAFGLFGLKSLWFGRVRTHRFERARAQVTIDSQGLLKSERRELPFQRIADIVLEEVRGRGRPSYYVHYVTTRGERVPWADSFDGSKHNTLACFEAAREFVGLATASADPQTLQPQPPTAVR